MAIPDKSYIGKGKTFAQNTSSGTAGLVAFGNVSALSLTHEETEITQTDYTRPGGATRNIVSRVDSVGVTLTLTDFNADNLERLLRGSSTRVTTASVSDESISVPATLDSDTLLETAATIDTTETVTVTSDPAGTTFVSGTDYEVVGAGIVVLPGGSISASDDLLVSYTSKTVDRVEAVVGSAPEFRVVFSGVNEAQADVPLVLTMYKVKFSLPADVSLIADEFGALELTGELLSDSSITATDESQYYKVEVA
jgi:hypothetical protein